MVFVISVPTEYRVLIIAVLPIAVSPR